MKNEILRIIRDNITGIDNLTDYEKFMFYKILNCRTEPVPGLKSKCCECGTYHTVYKSCKRRLCPVCNGSASIKWIAKREAELLPTGYFMLTFTLPSELRSLFLLNKKRCYNMLFKCVSQTINNQIKEGFREFKGLPGFFSVLHTWDQRLNFHAHIHTVIPAGCISTDKTKWIDSNPSFILPVRKLSAEFKIRMIKSIRKEFANDDLIIPEEISDKSTFTNLLEDLYHKKWVVHSQAPGIRKNPDGLIRYLARYVHKSAVSTKRIVKVEDGNVYLRYMDRKNKTGKVEVITEKVFMQRLVLHILPKGFKKVRFYGFMANHCRERMLVLCRTLMGIPVKAQEPVSNESVEDTAFLFWKYFGIDILLCPDCGKGHLEFVQYYGSKGG